MPTISQIVKLNHASAVALVAVIYWLSALFGLSHASLDEHVSPVWPPTGVALAALLLLGPGVWPGITLGALVANGMTGPLAPAVGIAVGNTLEAVVGAALLRRSVGFHPAMDRARDVVGLMVCSAVLSTAISATIGVSSLCLLGAADWAVFRSLWWTWWVGDAMGALVVAPFLLISGSALRGGNRPPRLIESTICLVAIGFLSGLVFAGQALPLEFNYLIFPLFVWSALRLGQLVTSAGIVLAAAIAVYGAHSISPGNLNFHLLLAQSFLGVLAVGSLTLGAVVAERERLHFERNMLLQSEQAARAKAERFARQKDEFVATLSHELRTPLTGLLGWTRVLSRDEDKANLSERVQAIDRCAQTIANLIDDLADAARIISGKVSLHFEPVRLSRVLDASLEIIRPAAQAKHMELEHILQADPVVSGDPKRLKQVVCNLLNNAVKFTPAYGRILMRLESTDDCAILSVTDNGMGIDPENLPHIFDRYRQGQTPHRRKYGGLGLGLDIVRHIVQLHGGSVSAQSEGLTRGATFVIRLPRLDETKVTESVTASMNLVGLSGLRVLLVDDDQDATAFLSRILEENGAEVAVAHGVDPAAPLKLLAECPHLLLSDIGLPGFDGYQLIREIRAAEDPLIRDVPAIAVTAFARPEDRRRALDAGFNAHVGKPVDVAELMEVIARVLREARESNQLRTAGSNHE